MIRSNGVYGEAEAVVAEALILEREVLRDRDGVCGWPDGRRTDREQVNELWNAVIALRDLATRMQNPLRHSPYSALGEKVAGEATVMLNEIRSYKVEEPIIIDDV